MKTFISCFVLIFAIAFANGAPASSETSNKNDEIKAKVDDAVETSEKSDHGSILGDLGNFLATLVIPPVTGVLDVIPNLKEIISGAVEGGSLLGIIDGIAGGVNKIFKNATAQIGIDTLSGSDTGKNKKITEDMKGAVDLSQKQDGKKRKNPSDLNNVKELLNLYLTFVPGFIETYVTSPIQSGIRGLLNGLKDKGIVGGLKGLTDGLTDGQLGGFRNLVTNLLLSSSSDQ